MAQSTPQTFENHTRLVPMFHMVLFGILLVNFGWSVYKLFRAFIFDNVVAFLLAFGLIVLSLYARIFALRVQDRVIRLEMRLRMQKVLTADLQSRIDEFSAGQMVALRFASDEELPELARKVLAEKIEDGKAIKRMIKKWNPDYLRA